MNGKRGVNLIYCRRTGSFQNLVVTSNYGRHNLPPPLVGISLCTARSIEIVPRGGPLQNSSTYSPKKGGPPLEFINIQPPKRGLPLEFINQRGSASRYHQPKRDSINQKGGPPLGTISMDLAACYKSKGIYKELLEQMASPNKCQSIYLKFQGIRTLCFRCWERTLCSAQQFPHHEYITAKHPDIRVPIRPEVTANATQVLPCHHGHGQPPHIMVTGIRNSDPVNSILGSKLDKLTKYNQG